MATPVLDDTTARTPDPHRSRRTRWVAPLAAAAAVAAVVGGTVWWAGGDDAQRIVAPSSPVTPVDSGYRAILDEPGWLVENTSEDRRWGGEISYANGDQRFDVTWYPKDSYAEYVEDREHIYDPPAAGEPVEVLGLGGQLWHYSPQDHTVIREVQAGHWMEFRGSGMDDAAFRELLGRLTLVDKAGLESSLPPAYVASGERAEAIQVILEEIDEVADPLAPPGVTFDITSEESDPYQLGADVTGVVACAWIEEFAAAQGADDQARMETAQGVLATTRDWPVLQRMNRDGDWPEVMWEISAEVVGGTVPPEYFHGLGCDAPPPPS